MGRGQEPHNIAKPGIDVADAYGIPIPTYGAIYQSLKQVRWTGK